MATKPFIQNLKEFGQRILPPQSSLWLYGSRARNQAREDSDWDVLILLDKDCHDTADLETYCWPFNDIGFEYNQYVSPQLYTRNEWQAMRSTSFAQNVERDKIILI